MVLMKKLLAIIGFGLILFKFFSVSLIKSTTILFIKFLTNSFLNLSLLDSKPYSLIISL